MKFTGAVLNDVVAQFNGPFRGINYSGSGIAYCCVAMDQIGGSAAVKVQSNIVGIAGNDGGVAGLVPSPSGWTDVATVSTEGVKNIPLTVQTVRNWVRVIVSHTGTGSVCAAPLWSNANALIPPDGTFAQLPPAPVLGTMAVVRDGGSLAIGDTISAGGGSTKYLVWFNGVNWTVAGK